MNKNPDSNRPASTEVSPEYVAAIAALHRQAQEKETAAIQRAAERYRRRRDRLEDPRGSCDRAGRWFPDYTENFVLRGYRIPSRTWPWSYMLACRTIAHCARLEGIPQLVSEVRKAARKLDQEAKSANKEAQAK
jgi:hypothetical protein